VLITAGIATCMASLAFAGSQGPATSQRVLLISIDGMHALDFQNCVVAKTCPNLAALGMSGVTYTRTSTSKPSDSFPGLMAIVSGGTPKLVGAYYDVA
jgi:predicted AlkP superfamily pyrophosphatase or phosphodiesterase